MLKHLCLALGIATCLSGCAAPPDTLQSSPEGITLRWSKNADSFDGAQQIAAAHCASAGKEARLARDWTDQDMKIARFECR